MRESKGKTKLTFGRPVTYSKKGPLWACALSLPAAGGQQQGTGLQRESGSGREGLSSPRTRVQDWDEDAFSVPTLYASQLLLFSAVTVWLIAANNNPLWAAVAVGAGVHYLFLRYDPDRQKAESLCLNARRSRITSCFSTAEVVHTLAMLRASLGHCMAGSSRPLVRHLQRSFRSLAWPRALPGHPAIAPTSV